MMQHLRRPAVVGLVASVALVAAALAIWSAGRGESHATARSQPTFAVTAQGRLDSAVEARSLVADRDGSIERVLVRPGQQVVAGEPLVRIRCDDLEEGRLVAEAQSRAAAAQSRLVREGPRQEEVRAAQAAEAAATARVRDAQDAYDRAKGLEVSRTISARAVANYRNALDMVEAEQMAAAQKTEALERGPRADEVVSASANAQAAAARARSLAASLAKCVVRAPIDGQVLRLLRREGEFSGASQGAVILTLGDTRSMIVRMEIDQRDAAKVALGARAQVWVEGEPRRFSGKVTELSLQMGRKTARSLDPSDRFDRDIREAIVRVDDAELPRLVGLRVNVGILAR